MTIIFHDFLHNLVEGYVDDLVVKTKERENHPHDLKRVFEKIRQHQLKINPFKYVFGVTSGKFLGFVVWKEGVEIDPAKVKAIIQMSPPRNFKNCGVYREGWLTYDGSSQIYQEGVNLSQDF